MPINTLVRGGRLVSPADGRDGLFDIGIEAGKIAFVRPTADQPDPSSVRVIDATGQIVTPGLIDLHAHLYWGATYWGVEPDPISKSTGVTTWLDAGSAGAYNFYGFLHHVIKRSASRILVALNVSSIGLVAPTYENSNLDYLDLGLAKETIEANRDLIVAIKCRIDRLTTRGTGIEPLRLARRLADEVDLPLMVHIGSAPPTIEEIFALLQPGDILTHCFTGNDNRIVDFDGALIEEAKLGIERGVILDIGHGGGGFSFETTEKMAAMGLWPDVISTDAHQLSVQGPMFDLPTVISKFLTLGMSLTEAIERVTVGPAQAIRRPELASLAEGARADIAIFRLEAGSYRYRDTLMNERRGTQRLINTETLIEGRRVEEIVGGPVEAKPLMSWAELPEHQRGDRSI